MSGMNKRRLKIILPVLAACLAVAVLTLCLTTSYLKDVEQAENVITIGKVSLELTEGGFNPESSYVVAAGGTLDKAPKITNNGKNDEYVFIKLSIPKKPVDLLADKASTINGTEYSEGAKITLPDGMTNVELFRTIADGVTGGAKSTLVTYTGKTGYVPPIYEIKYNAGDTTDDKSIEGWVFLKVVYDRTEGTGDAPKTYDDYYFGYNKRLAAVTGTAEKNSTITLFDKIQLKSIIDTTVNENQTVKVVAYGIQADELGLSLPAGNTLLSNAQVESVFKIVENKQKGGGT